MAEIKHTIEFVLKETEIFEVSRELVEILNSIEEDFPWNKELSEARIKLMYIISSITIK